MHIAIIICFGCHVQKCLSQSSLRLLFESSYHFASKRGYYLSAASDRAYTVHAFGTDHWTHGCQDEKHKTSSHNTNLATNTTIHVVPVTRSM